MREDLSNIKVLVIEDEGMIAWMVQSLLEDIGFSDIDIASNGVEAMTMASVRQPSLIISDINLGMGPDGIEVSHGIAGSSTTPVIFVSAYADEITQARIAKVLPTAKLIRKPFSLDLLRQEIDMALAA